MKKYLVVLLAIFTSSVVCAAELSSGKLAYFVKVGLVDDRAPPAAVPDETKSCEGVTLSRNLSYGESKQNVLDIILNIETPLLLAWSMQDPPRTVAEGEKLEQRLCNSATHCPHTTLLGYRESLASVFEADPSGGGLALPTLELVREIEERGLP
jgi:hypothetical protein